MPLPVDFGSVFESSPTASGVLDRDLRWVAVNKAYLVAVSAAREELLGHTVDEWLAHAGAAGAASLRLLRESCQRVLSTRREDVLVRVSFPRSGGSPLAEEQARGLRTCRVTHTPVLGSTGEVDFILQQVVDCTGPAAFTARGSGDENVAATALPRGGADRGGFAGDPHHLVSLFDQAPGFLAFFRGPELILELANPAFRKLVGDRDLVGKPARQVLPDLGGEDGFVVLQRVLASRAPFVAREMKLSLRATDDRPMERYVDFVARPIHDDEGNPVGMFVLGHDVTEGKRHELERQATEQVLRASEDRYRTLFATIDEGFCVIEMLYDADGRPVDYRYLETNPAFAAHTGLENASGRTIRELVPELDESWFRIYGEVARTGIPVRVENPAPAMGRWFEVFASRIGEPHLRHVVVIFKDITERKAAEAALRASEAQAREARDRAVRERLLLDAVLEAAPVGIIVADANGRLLRMNPANARLWGAAPHSEGIEGYGEWKGWWADNGPRHGQRVQAQEWAMARALRGHTVLDDVVDIEPFEPSGGRRTILNSGAPVRDAEGRIVGAVVAQMDITGRVAAENAMRMAQARAAEAEVAMRRAAEEERERLHALFTQAPVAIAIVSGPDYTIELANPLVCRLWGRTAEQLLNRPVFEALPEAAEQGFPQLLDEVRRTGVPFVGNEVPARFARLENGALEDVYLNFVYQPLRNREGQVDGIMALATDVTEGVRSRQRVEALRAEAEQAVRLRDEFLSVASHELKTPLTSLTLKLQSSARLIDRSGGAEDSERGAVEFMRRQVRRLSDLVNDLLDVSRISSGRLTLELERVNLSELVGEITSRFEVEATRAGCTIDVATAPDVVGTWDRLRLEQVLTNLLTNAIKYGAGKPIHVELEQDGGRAKLIVRDAGIGIAPEALGRIFGKFERAVSDRHYGGLGLGLFITHQIVEAMGGTIGVETELGHGATFKVELPLSPPAG